MEQKKEYAHRQWSNTIGERYFCIDIETTGLKADKGDILEIYWKIMEYRDGIEVKIKENHRLFWDWKWWKTRKIHQIPIKELLFQPHFNSEKSDSFREEIENYILKCKDPEYPLVFMAQYAPFELSWFEEKLKINMDDIKVFDTRLAEKELYPDVSHSLIAICKRRNISPPEGQYDFHRASQDVDAMWEVAKQQFEELKSTEKVQDQI